MATKTKTAKGFQVRCICCGAEDAVWVSLQDTESFSCSSCSEPFAADDVRAMIAGWERVLAWIESAPARE
jgi:hypothetical protein